MSANVSEVEGYGYCRVPTAGQRQTHARIARDVGGDAADAALVAMTSCDAYGAAYLSPDEAAGMRSKRAGEFAARLAAARRAIEENPVMWVDVVDPIEAGTDDEEE